MIPKQVPSPSISPSSSTPEYQHLGLLGVVPLPVLIGAVILFNAILPPPGQLSRSLTFEPPFLNAILYTVFLAFTSFVVAVLAFKSYLKDGRLFLMLLGCAALAWGSTSLISGWLTNLASGPNPAITISNTGALFAGVFHAASGFSNKQHSSQSSLRLRKSLIIIAYSGVIILTGVLATEALIGGLPPFFILGTGQTVLRMVVLSLAALLFGVSSILFARLYPSKSGTLYWYFLSLALTGVGLASVFFGRAPGDPISWSGRIAMFLGGTYLLKAVFFAFREHHA